MPVPAPTESPPASAGRPPDAQANGADAATAGQVTPAPPAVAARAPARRPAELSAEQRLAVEMRYLELASPQEFDGIRSQIASELELPRALVKRAVNDLRQRLGRPSWWDLQRAALPPEVVEAVKPRYLALLAEQPLPPVGVHRQLAGDLSLSTLDVYRAIGQIRAELGLPKFNERPEEAGTEAAAEAVNLSP
jgi:hypothetical protein